jgi:hypothetical protein
MQDFIAILIVIAAAAFLGRRAWLALAGRKAGACGSCVKCPSNQPKLVNISDLSHAEAQRREDGTT